MFPAGWGRVDCVSSSNAKLIAFPAEGGADCVASRKGELIAFPAGRGRADRVSSRPEVEFIAFPKQERIQ